MMLFHQIPWWFNELFFFTFLFITTDWFLILCPEIEKTQKDEGKEEEKFIDVVINKNMKLGQKVLIPVKQFPKVSVSAPASPPETSQTNVTHADEEFKMLLYIDNESTTFALEFDLNHLQQPLDTQCWYFMLLDVA